ncbi:MAG: hypothetical protein J6S69_08865, partial [Proteobacteria bacterium]|nr:hypothetical protein [Pseudomonadota bacterium]
QKTAALTNQMTQAQWNQGVHIVFFARQNGALSSSAASLQSVTCASTLPPFIPCFLEIPSILRQKTAALTNQMTQAQWNQGVHIVFFCSTEWRAFFVSRSILLDSKGAQLLWWGPGQSPGGVWGSAPKEFSAHLCVCGNASQNLHYPNKSD